MKSNIEKILIISVLITVSACGKSNRFSGESLESGQESSQEANPNAPAILVKELSTQTSVGNTILDVYTGSPETTDLNVPIGTLTGTIESQQYDHDEPKTTHTSSSNNFPVYFNGMGTAGVRLSVFVDATTAAQVSHPFISDIQSQAKIPLNFFCVDYLVKNPELTALPSLTEFQCSFPDGGEAGCVPNIQVFADHCDETCRHQNYLNIQGNLNNYDCKETATVYPQVLTEEDYVKLSSLDIAIDPTAKDLPADANNQSIHITEDQWSFTL